MRRLFNKIFVLAGIVALVFGLIPLNQNLVYADDLELIGNDLGLVVEPASTNLFDLKNLNPGDTTEASITIKNDYKDAFGLFMRAERLSPVPEEGDVDLLDQLEMTIYIDGEEIYKGPVKDFALANIDLGKFEPGAEKVLRAVVHLPGAETGNDFQGTEGDVKWIFIAQADETLEEEDPDPTPDPKPDPKPPKKPDETLGEETLPKTGQGSNMIYIIIGAALLLLGLTSIYKEKTAK